MPSAYSAYPKVSNFAFWVRLSAEFTYPEKLMSNFISDCSLLRNICWKLIRKMQILFSETLLEGTKHVNQFHQIFQFNNFQPRKFELLCEMPIPSYLFVILLLNESRRELNVAKCLKNVMCKTKLKDNIISWIKSNVKSHFMSS